MSLPQINISLVISTLGRTVELRRLFESLVGQDRVDFEVILVDQNSDLRLEPLCKETWPFPVTWLRTPDERGLSRGRNVGLRVAVGEFVMFPDDDCWYPPWFLSRGMKLISDYKVDVLTGRAADEAGRDINGRYSEVPQKINRTNVWISGIEWVMLFKKSALSAAGGFDENVGVGAPTPWQSCEGQDLLLRGMEKGLSGQFDPSFYGHHEEFGIIGATQMQRKGRAYGRGLGYVLRVHRYGVLSTAWWIGRPVIRICFSLLKGDRDRGVYYLNVALGRLEGRIGRLFSS